MGFECNAKSDIESHETISGKQSKNENQILTSFTKYLEDKLRSSESLNSFISSYSNELTPDQENKVLADDEKSIQSYLNEQSSTKCEVSSDIKEEISESMYSLSNIHQHCKFSNENSSIKRTISPFEEIPKKLKKEHIRYESMDMNANAFKDLNAQTTIDPEFHSTAIPEQKNQSEFFISSLLEHMSKCDISSDGEANIVLLAVNVLMKLLLRYKLKDCVNVDVEGWRTIGMRAIDGMLDNILGTPPIKTINSDSFFNQGIFREIFSSQIRNALKFIMYSAVTSFDKLSLPQIRLVGN
ncbi:hypothetical protein TNCV_724731 [Trichonephila clavipes]|nr:hypothetical protein TNCV_724731 [Trichonephila clavipes]